MSFQSAESQPMRSRRFKVFGYRGTACRRRRAHAVDPKASSANNAAEGSGTAAALMATAPALIGNAVPSSL